MSSIPETYATPYVAGDLLATMPPSSFHVATLWKVDPIEGVVQHSRGNNKRAELSAKENALLELMLAPEVYVAAGRDTFVDNVQEAFATGKIHKDALFSAIEDEGSATVQANLAKHLPDMFPGTGRVIEGAFPDQAPFRTWDSP